ncbi:MAG: Gfo/Idh/MocA family protein [Chthoniobacteraceae bacterium]
MTISLSNPELGINGYRGFALTHRLMAEAAEQRGLCQYAGSATYGATPSAEDARGRFHVSDLQELIGRLKKPGVVMSPSPIHFHRSDHQAVVQSGHACYLEKPPTLDPRELDEMIARDDAALFPSAVGFQHMAEPFRQQLKQRILAGEFGALQRISFLGLWQRHRGYYSRTNWAGRLKINDQLVLDSPFGNACSHYFHSALFWAGRKALWHWAEPRKVTAALFRANEIEGADTLFAKVLTTDGIPILFATSHACEEREVSEETIVCSEATITIENALSARIQWKNGKTEMYTLRFEELPVLSLTHYLHRLANPSGGDAIVTLRDCRTFVHLNALFYIASGTIHSVDPCFLTVDKNAVLVPGLGAAAASYVKTGAWPDSKQAPWFQTPGSANAEAIDTFPETMEKIIMQRQCAVWMPRHVY